MKDIGIYIHIPFCKSKCFYCDFNSYKGLEHLYEDYKNAIINEISFNTIYDKEISSIYIGGGTPNVIPEDYISQIMHILRENFNIKNSCEITIELNPGLITENKLVTYKKNGINRLSIGLQAFQNRLLSKIGRIHTVEEFYDNYEMASKYFKNINIDLMYALPGQSIKDWEETLNNIIDIRPKHISCYGLILEEGTTFYELYKNNKIELLNEDIEMEMYHNAIKSLTKNGYIHYEISNFSLQGYECKHNILYWKDRQYIGFGAGAHSYIDNKRYNNINNVSKYIDSINQKGKAIENEYILTKDDSMAEYMFLGLRMLEGICDEDFKSRFSTSLFDKYKDTISKYTDYGLIEIFDGNCIRLTYKGIDLSNIIFQEFLP